jgi:hypothetical protein
VDEAVSDDDVEIPAAPPRKRRQLESAPAKWLAVWASDESLPPSQRRRAQAERDRRKRGQGMETIVGLLVGSEGATPQQVEVMRERAHAGDVKRVKAPRPLKLGLKRESYVVCDEPWAGAALDERLKYIVRTSTTLVATPEKDHDPQRVEGVWEAVRYAKHRNVPVKVVMPDGGEHELSRAGNRDG